MNTGLKDSAARIPASRHKIQTGKFAPAILITGLHPEMKNKQAGHNRRAGRVIIASVF
jgi:hypothetical protein